MPDPATQTHGNLPRSATPSSKWSVVVSKSSSRAASTSPVLGATPAAQRGTSSALFCFEFDMVENTSVRWKPMKHCSGSKTQSTTAKVRMKPSSAEANVVNHALLRVRVSQPRLAGGTSSTTGAVSSITHRGCKQHRRILPRSCGLQPVRPKKACSTTQAAS